MKKKILITGVSGFIGSALAAHLYSCKRSCVLGVDRIGSKRGLSAFSRLDLLDEGEVIAFLKRNRPQVIFHLAGGRMIDPQVMFAANVRTTQVLLGAVLSIRGYHPRIVVMGSAAEYGMCSAKGKITEKIEGKVNGAYGLCKNLQTKTALYFASLGVNVMVGRLFNILGPGLPAATAGGAFARDIIAFERDLQAMDLNVGNLKAVRDFLDIRDICSALCSLAEKGHSGEIYNICSGKGVTIKELLQTMLQSSYRKKIVVREDHRQSPGVLSAVGSCAKLMKEIGWRPRYTLKQSISDTLVYYRSTAGAC